MMDVKELEDKIESEKKALSSLETLYEKEEDEKKGVKLEFRINRKQDQIDNLIDRQQSLLDKEAKDETKDEPKDKNEEEKDEDVCSSCGGDLIYLQTSDEGDIFECEKCHELYLDN